MSERSNRTIERDARKSSARPSLWTLERSLTANRFFVATAIAIAALGAAAYVVFADIATKARASEFCSSSSRPMGTEEMKHYAREASADSVIELRNGHTVVWKTLIPGREFTCQISPGGGILRTTW